MELIDALAAEGLVCVVGAGGKKSTLWALADRLDRAVVTATVRIPIFDDHVARVAVTDDPVAALRETRDDPDAFPLGLVPEREDDRDRYLGYDTETVSKLSHEGIADAVLVKADGARMREFKAPNDREPQVPADANTVLPIASVHAVGRSLTDEAVHRPDRVAALTGLDIGAEIRPADVAAVVGHPDGGLKGVPDGATVVPVLNKVDDDEDEALAREVAASLLEEPAVDRVALTRLIDPEEPLVDVVE
jgi:probable selenium-dependent hydroxylase accessory protein YqeC